MQLLKGFHEKVINAFTTTAKYLQRKLLIRSATLRSLSSLDPTIRGQSLTGNCLKKLAAMMKHLIPAESDVHMEIIKYNVDPCLAPYKEEEDVVEWWTHVMKTGRYPALNQVVISALSIFHGPVVESSFSLMNTIIDTRGTNMNMSTFNAVQTVKYLLQSRQKTAVEMFGRTDVKFGEVDRRLCRNIQSARTTDKAQRQRNLLQEERRRLEYG